jgi:hypothetical protein
MTPSSIDTSASHSLSSRILQVIDVSYGSITKNSLYDVTGRTNRTIRQETRRCEQVISVTTDIRERIRKIGAKIKMYVDCFGCGEIIWLTKNENNGKWIRQATEEGPIHKCSFRKKRQQTSEDIAKDNARLLGW